MIQKRYWIFNTSGVFFFSKLYSTVTIKEDSKEQFLSFVDKRIDKNDFELCDKCLNHDGIVKAVKEMANNKSPGSDGMTVEF